MFCKNCGTKLRDGAAFCQECGEKVITTVAASPIPATTPNQSNAKNFQKKLIPFILIGIVFVGIIGIILMLAIGGKDSDKRGDEGLDDAIENEDDSLITEEFQEDEPQSEATQPEESVLDDTPDEEPYESEVMQEDTSIHRYELIVADVTWTDAYNDCINRGGYLVHINSQEEFDVIVDQIHEENKGSIMFWLGAKRSSDSDTYYWVNQDGSYGTENLNNNPVYDNFWLSGEPSLQGTDADGQLVDEYCINMFYRSTEDRFCWNDASDDIIAIASFYAGRIGYICEYED